LPAALPLPQIVDLNPLQKRDVASMSEKDPKGAWRDPSQFCYIPKSLIWSSVKDEAQQSTLWISHRWICASVLDLSFTAPQLDLESVGQRGDVVEPWRSWLSGWGRWCPGTLRRWQSKKDTEKEENMASVGTDTNVGMPDLVGPLYLKHENTDHVTKYSWS